MSRLHRWGRRLAVALVGAFGALGFAPLHIWPATLLSLAALYALVRATGAADRPQRAAFGTGLLFGLGWFSASCFWIASAFVERGPSFIPMIPPLVGGLAVLLSLFWGAAAAVSVRLSRERPGWLAALIFTASFTLAELARGHVFSGFPWNMAAHAFPPGGWISQTASILNVYGLTMLALLVAALLGEAWRTRRAGAGIVGLLLLGTIAGAGGLRLSGAPAPNALPIQPGVVMRLVNVPFFQREKMSVESSIRITQGYVRESLRPGADRISHLVWPEGAVNGFATENLFLLRTVGAGLAAQTDRPPVWLLQTLREEVSPDPRTGAPRPRYYNSSAAVTFDRQGNPAVVATDDKRKLVPFGEFIPGGAAVEALGARLVSTALGSISGASEKRTVRYPGLPPLSVQICYEVIFPGLMRRDDPAAPPQLILNQSNDAWFGRTAGPDQHAAIARYRAIEEGLPMVRAAANGVSGVFDPYGRAVSTLDARTTGIIDVTVPLPLEAVFSTRFVTFALALLNLGLLLIGATWHRFGRSGPPGLRLPTM